MKHPITPHEIHVSRMVAFHRAVFDQFKERSGLTHREATNMLIRLYAELGEEGYKAKIDAIVDPELHSSVWEAERQEFLIKHYPHLVKKESVSDAKQDSTGQFQVIV